MDTRGSSTSNASGDGEGVRSDLSGFDRFVAVAIALWVLGLQIALGSTWPCNHDESWHTYFSAHDLGIDWLRDVVRDTHPPLSYVLMRPLTWLGTDPIWPRLASIVPSVIQVWLMLAILRRLRLSSSVVYAVTVVFASAYTFTVLGVVMRSYSLATMFVLAALERGLAITDGERVRGRGWSCVVFAVLAVWSVYPAGFALVAFGTSLVTVAMLRPRAFGRAREAWRVAFSWRHAFALGGGVSLCVAYFLVSYGPQELTHVAWFPRPGQSSTSFVLAGLNGILGDLTPLPVDASSGPWVVAGAVVAWLYAWKHAASSPARGIALVCLPCLLGMLAILGLLRWYPFGGEARHMYVLFPFGVVAFACVLDAVSGWFAHMAWRVTLAVMVVTVGGVAAVDSFAEDPMLEICTTTPFAAEIDVVFTPDTAGRPVYLTTSAFGAWYSDLRQQFGWEFRGRTLPPLHEFCLGETWTVFRDERSWSISAKYHDHLFEQLDRIVAHTGTRQLVVFGPSYEAAERSPESLASSARAHGYTVERIASPGGVQSVFWLQRN